MVILLTRDYLASRNCRRELVEAVRLRRPLIVLRETSVNHGAVTLAAMHDEVTACLVSDAEAAACDKLIEIVAEGEALEWHREEHLKHAVFAKVVQMVHTARCEQMGLPASPPIRVHRAAKARRSLAESSRRSAVRDFGQPSAIGQASELVRSGVAALKRSASGLRGAKPAVPGGRLPGADDEESAPLRVYMSAVYSRLQVEDDLGAWREASRTSATRSQKKREWVERRGEASSVREQVARAMETVHGEGAVLSDELSRADAVLVLLCPAVFDSAELVGELTFLLAQQHVRDLRGAKDPSSPGGMPFVFMYSTAVPFDQYISAMPRQLRELGLLNHMFDKFPRSQLLQDAAAEHAVQALPSAAALWAAKQAEEVRAAQQAAEVRRRSVARGLQAGEPDRASTVARPDQVRESTLGVTDSPSYK